MPRPTTCLLAVHPARTYWKNLPASYVRRQMQPKHFPTVKRKWYRHTEEGPWSQTEQGVNSLLGKKASRSVPPSLMYHEPLKEWKIFVGDRVQVLIGRDKGKLGTVIQVVPERNWCFVQGLALRLETMTPFEGLPSQVSAKETPLSVVSEVTLVDPSDEQPCDVEWRYNDAGERVRVSLRTGRLIPMPELAEETYEYKTRTSYYEEEKDTTAKSVRKRTFVPALTTFEQDIAKHAGIKDDRKWGRTFWY